VATKDGWSARDPKASLEGVTQVMVVRDPRALDAPMPAPDGARQWTICTLPTGMPPVFVHPTRRPVDANVLHCARVYLPVLVGHALAAARGAVFVVAHVTQTLDGRIACHNGQSQWIGNDEDLRHAHRMRALCDGVLVGAGTALNDDPQLNVRHVAGRSPRRILVSGSGKLLETGRHLRALRSGGVDLVVGADVAVAQLPAEARLHRVARTQSGELPPTDILQALCASGIHSIYLEGGARTLSSFLQADAVDLLQVHIANLLLGSGLPSFSLPLVDHVNEGRRFAMDHGALDGHLLLSCWPLRAKGA
jgi:5-amino-6-(5-phosphoribosylamino)uracil reductase/diaminohydroxyphosphoribosylaminopyrimidine deaminase/5-amino-6-(5-phosphoribosylamino)uracil reductase